MVSELTHERCGGVSISDQHIQQIVIEQVRKIGLLQEAVIKKSRSSEFPILGIANLYDADKKEAIWMEDGFCVSQQKLNRDKVAKKGKETATTDVRLLQTPTGRFEHIIAAQRIDLTDFATAKFKEYYSQKK